MKRKKPPAVKSPSAALRKKFLNHKVSVSDGGMEVYCWCDDATFAYGNPRLLVTPVAGEGCEWVAADRCRVMEGKRETPPDEQAGDHQPATGQPGSAIDPAH